MIRDIIRALIQEEMSGASAPTPSEPITATAVSDRRASFARLAALREQSVAIAAKQTELEHEGARVARELQIFRDRQSEIHSECLENSFSIHREEAVLLSTASPQIDNFISAMQSEHFRLMGLVPNSTVGFSDKNLLDPNPKRRKQTFSNAPAINRRALAVIAARSRAQELKQLDLSEEQLRAELESLEAVLPAIESFELVRE